MFTNITVLFIHFILGYANSCIKFKKNEWINVSGRGALDALKAAQTPDVEMIDWLIDWGLTALSARIGYIMPLKNMFHLKNWN